MKFIKINITEEEFKELEDYGTVWYRNEGKIIAIEIDDKTTLNLVVAK